MVKTAFKILLILSIFLAFGTQFSSAQQGDVVVNQSDEITQLLELKKEINKSQMNFKIQIYNGSHGGAIKMREEFKKAFDKWPIDMHYETPNYKIWVGDFKNRLEADKALIEVKRKFANAFIFKPKKEKNTP